MILSNALAVYALGMRHGADPDHLAAIDNLTRNSIDSKPVLSRFVGTLFACGHTAMLLAIAALVGFLGARFRAQGPAIEQAGTWISIALLFLLAMLNIWQLAAGKTNRITGFKTRLLPAFIRNASSPWTAIPVGLLFGFGFETSSQVAAYVIAFGGSSGATGGIAVASLFCFGMICSDTLDSLLIHRLASYRPRRAQRVTRLWVGSVTAFAITVAAYELAQILGWKSPLSDLAVSVIFVTSLFAIFACSLALSMASPCRQTQIRGRDMLAKKVRES